MLAGGNSDIQGIINNTSTGNLSALSCHAEVYQFSKVFTMAFAIHFVATISHGFHFPAGAGLHRSLGWR